MKRLVGYLKSREQRDAREKVAIAKAISGAKQKDEKQKRLIVEKLRQMQAAVMQAQQMAADAKAGLGILAQQLARTAIWIRLSGSAPCRARM